ncbi:MAG: hypothetical protein RIG61_01510 [Deltaproteobacteria bacterium]
MQPTTINNYSVRANCPDCGGAILLFDHRKSGGGEYGSIIAYQGIHQYQDETFNRVVYTLVRCSGCGRGGIAKFHDNGNGPGTLETFYPRAVPHASLPTNIPDKIMNEFREAELCYSFEAWRAASALLRSTLEKTLKEKAHSDI